MRETDVDFWKMRSLRLPYWAGQGAGQPGEEVESDCETETECGVGSVCVSTWSAEENEEETRVTNVESEGSSEAGVEFEEDTTEESNLLSGLGKSCGWLKM